MKILIVNGPNLDMLGRRDPAVYGTATLADAREAVACALRKHGRADVGTEWFQSNSEGAIIDRLHACLDDGTDAVVINGGAYAHYSYAIRDALELLTVPVVEVHLSNIYAREAFRRESVLSAVCDGVIVGFGILSYCHGVEAALELAEG